LHYPVNMEIVWSSQCQQEEAIENFRYVQDARLIICREHGYAVRNLDRHLLDYHDYSRDIRKTIAAQFRGVPLVAPETASLPKAYGPPIEDLAPPRRGFLCEESDCGCVSSRRATIAEHCNKHGWRSLPGEREHWREVWIQSFSLTPGKQRWFIVRVEEEPGEDAVHPISEEVLAQKETILQDFDGLTAQRKQQVEVLEREMDKTERTGWWKRTDWPTHLHKANLKHLAHAARLPDKEDNALKKVGDAVDALIEECVKGLRSLPLELRRWLKSVQMNEVDQRPMGRLQNQDSQDRYAIYWKRLICYTLRVVQSQPSSEIEDAQPSEGEEAQPSGGEESSSETLAVAPTCLARQDKMADARRLFPWLAGQKELALEVLKCAQQGGGGDIARSLLDLSATFIFQKVYHQPFESPMLHFMAILGIDAENNRLRTGNDYSYMLAGLLYCTRVVGLELMLPSNRRTTQGVPEFDAFLEKRKQFLADGSMSAVSNMISLLAYGKHIALNHGNAGGVFWEMERRVMNLHGMRIIMEKFKAMVQRAITDAEEMFWDRLMWTPDPSDRLVMDIDKLTDDITFRKLGAYFVENRHNGVASKWKDVTMDKMLTSSRGKKMHRNGRWHTRLVREYMREVDKFRKLLLFCIHITGGQPARGTEILSLRFKNGSYRDRNIFIMDGFVTTVTLYNKTEAEWDTPKVVPRFLPWRVGQLLALYLVYSQPFVEMVSVRTGQGCGWSEYIWADDKGPWETPKLTSILRHRTGQDLGHALGTLDFRHAAVGIGRVYVGDTFASGYKDEAGEIEEPEMETDDPLEISAGRGSAVGVNRYAVRSDIVRHLSQRNMDTFRPLSESWHRFLGLESRKTATAASVVSKRKGEELKTPVAKAKKVDISWAGGLMTPASFSTGHDAGSTTTIATPNSMGSPSTPGGAMRTPVPVTNMFSSPLQRFAVSGNFAPSSPQAPPPPPTRAKPAPSFVDTEQQKKAVRKALGLAETAAVAYKSPEQEEALERILNGLDSALAVVLPTGGGKSLLFTAPACLDDPGMSIVVIPYKQLMVDTVEDAKGLGIGAVEWSHDLHDPADIVFVSADKLNNTFFDYAARMAGKGLVRRVFIDECHLAVTAHSWRPKMVSLARLRCIEAPTIMLTATLPLHMEGDLETSMLCELSLTLIRACTARRATKYIVRAGVEGGKLMEEAIEVCSKRLARLKNKAKMVVYCRSKGECEQLAEALGCNFFFSGSADNEDVIKIWKEAGGCVVATTALGTGVNYTGVTLAVHVGMPYGLIDFAQESGRAGRGGEVVTSLILLEKDWQTREQARRLAMRRAWSPDEKAMLDFVNTDDCRRLILGRYFDRKPAQDCVSGGMERCDRCCNGISDWARSEEERVSEREAVEEALDQMANGCPVCWVAAALGSDRGWMHDGRTCRQRERIPLDTGDTLLLDEKACDQFRATIRYLDGSKTCHACGISQKMCHTRESGQGGCQWPRIAIPIVMLATSNTFGRNIIRQAGYEDEPGDWAAYALWLGQPHRLRLWGELVSNSMVVIKDFLIYCKQELKAEPWDAESMGDFDEPEHECEEGGLAVGSTDGNDATGSSDIFDSDVLGDYMDGNGDDAGAGGDDKGNEDNEDDNDVAQVAPTQRYWRRQSRVIESVLDPNRLRELTDEWHEQCAVCKASGKIARGHRHWSECSRMQGVREKMSEVIKILEGVRFTSFAHCKWCYRSQAVCEMWARSVNLQGRVVFKKKPGVDCKYGSWVLEATAAFLVLGADGGLEEWRARDPSLAALKQEMGKKHRRGEVEFSGLFGYFYTWA
jgi:superfamily II DNA helicase RecQ